MIYTKPTRKAAVKKKPAPKKVTIIAGERRAQSERRILKVPHEELNTVEQAVADAQDSLDTAWTKLKKWYRSP